MGKKSYGLNDNEHSATVDRAELVRLAEHVLDRGSRELAGSIEEQLREELARREEKLEQLDEDDELYQITAERYETLRNRLQEYVDPAGDEIRARFVKLVAEEFVPAGPWLHPKVVRAINQELYGKPTETLTVARMNFPSERDRTADEKFEAALALREDAAEWLAEHEGLRQRLAAEDGGEDQQ